MIITLPFPDMRLSPNRSKGHHWATTAKLRKQARIAGFMATLEASKGVKMVAGKRPIKITFIGNRMGDVDNLLAALKPTLDGVADGLKCNDKDFDPVTVSREIGK